MAVLHLGRRESGMCLPQRKIDDISFTIRPPRQYMHDMLSQRVRQAVLWLLINQEAILSIPTASLLHADWWLRHAKHLSMPRIRREPYVERAKPISGLPPPQLHLALEEKRAKHTECDCLLSDTGKIVGSICRCHFPIFH